MLLKGCQETPQGSNFGRLCGSRRLRHLLPRPSSSITNNFAPCSINSNKCFSMNHQQTDHVQSRKEEKHMEHIVSSRWNPTPEQLMALEEMYRRGVRTPSAEEIKLIAAKLKQFGKIEAKNVFYWFQNHKARERQKRRRQPEPRASDKFGNDHEALEGSDKGFCSKDMKAQENNKSATSLKDPRVSMQRPMVTEDGEMQQMKNQRKMSKASDTFINATDSSGNQEMQKMMLRTLNFSIFSPSSSHNTVDNKEDGATRDHQITLELFPLQKDGENERDFEVYRANKNPSSVVPPNQFYEFL